ncbi:MAG TPA: hypothetical protein ENG05_03585 [Acidilobales archaeon]|nr:hypothetical protein [Acidilobales archaeon]
MVLQRKTLALDEDIINKLKEIAIKRGTTLSNYLRNLFSEVIDLEERGYFAPKALREKKFEYILNSLGFIYIPKDLIGNLRSDYIERVGSKLGVVLKELKVSVVDVIELLTMHSQGSVITESNKVILIAMPGTVEYYLNKLVAEIAKATGLNVNDTSTLISIELPEETLKLKLKEFERRRGGRRRRR